MDESSRAVPLPTWRRRGARPLSGPPKPRAFGWRGRLIFAAAAPVALAVAELGAASVAVAGAGIVGLHACDLPALSQPFARWADPASYELSPAGDFESSGWSLSGGAEIVSGSEPYASTGTLGSSSLSLPGGASAQSPPTCVDATYPTVRLFIEGSGSVAVAVVSDGVDLSTGVAVAGGDWQPTLPMVTAAPVFGLLRGGSAEVNIRIWTLTGNPVVDDVWVDPWNRG